MLNPTPKQALAILLTLICANALAEPAPLSMDFQRDALSLHGTWQGLLNHPNEPLYETSAANEVTGWKNVEIPKGQIPGDTWQVKTRPQCAWLRRDFNVTESQAARDAVLKWNGIRFGATTWLNSRQVDSYPNIGPRTILLPQGTLRPGQNNITLKLNGWASLEKSESGFPLIPAGSGTQDWGAKTTAVYDDIWLEFYDHVYAKYILAAPDLANKTVTFRIWLDSAIDLPRQIQTTATVSLLEENKPAGSTTANLATADPYAELTVKLDNVKPWTPLTPTLYRAELTFTHQGKRCDNVVFNFGMREIKVTDGHYRLNGKRLRFHGSNLVNEWNWGGYDSPFNRETKRYIVDEARNMSLNSFRTHTLPPPTSWLDVADTYGTMILAEFPILYNYGDPKFTPEQWNTFHANALEDVTAWVTKLANHPSIMIWVLSNESNKDEVWETTTLRDHVLGLDPTRPTLRTGEQTAETVDLHPCDTFSYRTDGNLNIRMAEAAAHKDPKRTFGNSEYMNIFGPTEKISMRWLGRHSEQDFKNIFAEVAAEHTEAMRRLDFDLILPYMYAGWTALRGNKWQQGFPTPMAAALHSTMAPVFASLDLFDRNHLAGARLSVPLHLINDTHQRCSAAIDLSITTKDPLFIPDPNAIATAVWQNTKTVRLEADSHQIRDVTIPVPAAPGLYYLTAVLTQQGHRPVVSQRIIRSVRITKPSELGKKRIIVLGGDALAEQWLMASRISFTDALPPANTNPDVIVIWDASNLGAPDRARAADIIGFVEAGARLVILDHKKWDWPELLDLQIARAQSDVYGTAQPSAASRVFPFAGTDGDILLSGIDPEYLKRWNGLPGTIADHCITGKILDKCRKLLWGINQDIVFAASLSKGDGEIVLCQLQLKSHLKRNTLRYDPVAEQILLNLLGR